MYLEDLLLHTPRFNDTGLLEQVLATIKVAILCIHPQNCHCLQHKVQFFCHMVSHKATNLEKVALKRAASAVFALR